VKRDAQHRIAKTITPPEREVTPLLISRHQARLVKVSGFSNFARKQD